MYLLRWKWLAAALVVALAVAVSGYFVWSGGWMGKKQDLTRNMKAEEVLTAARDKAGTQKSYRFNSKISLGEQIKVNLINRVKQEQSVQQLADLDWNSPQGNGITTIYLRDKEIYILHPIKGKWFKPEEMPEVRSIASVFQRQMEVADPLTALRNTNLQQKTLNQLPEEEIAGQAVKVIEVTAPGAAEDLKNLLPPTLIGAKPVEVKQTYWIGKNDLLIHQYKFRAKIKLLGFAGPALDITSKVSDFNKTEFQLPKALLSRLGQDKS